MNNSKTKDMSKELNVSIPDVIEMVKVKGMTRDEIAEHYGISKKACREQIFSHPELKGIRKPQKPRGVKINLLGASEETEGASKEETTEDKPSEDGPISEGDGAVQGETATQDTEEEVEETQEETEEAATDTEEEEETEEESETEDKPSSGVEW